MRVPLERRPGDVRPGSRIVAVMIVVFVVEVRRVVCGVVTKARVHVGQLAARMVVDDQPDRGRRDRDGKACRHHRGEIASHDGRTPGRERATV